jgi:VWFA-related protein
VFHFRNASEILRRHVYFEASLPWTIKMKRLALLLLCSLAFAQQPAPKPQTFTSRSELVLVPVIVHDKSGKHIGGLKREQFELLDNGKPQPSKIFEEVHTQAITTGPKRTGKEFGNYVLDPQNQRRITIILFDFEFIPFSEQFRAREKLVHFLTTQLEPNEPVALLALTGRGIEQIHGFTTDTRVLIDAANHLKRKMPGFGSERASNEHVLSANELSNKSTSQFAVLEENSLGQLFSDANTYWEQRKIGLVLSSLESIAGSYGGIPGKKNLLWITGGFRYPSTDTLEDNLLRQSIERIWHHLNSANISVYPLDVYGLTLPNIAKFDSYGMYIHGVPDPRNQPRGVPVQMPELNERKFEQDTFHLFADATGGHPCINNNDIADCMERAAHDSESYYLLGFYLRPEDRNTGLHKLTVKLNTPHADLRYRQNYDTSDEPDLNDPKKHVLSAYNSPLDYTELSLDVVLGDPQPDGAKTKLPLAISLPPASVFVDRDQNNLTEVEFGAAAFNDRDLSKSVAEASQTLRGNLKTETMDKLLKEGLTHKLELDLPPGQYHVKCVVYDHLTGKTGSVTAPVEIK